MPRLVFIIKCQTSKKILVNLEISVGFHFSLTRETFLEESFWGPGKNKNKNRCWFHENHGFIWLLVSDFPWCQWVLMAFDETNNLSSIQWVSLVLTSQNSVLFSGCNWEFYFTSLSFGKGRFYVLEIKLLYFVPTLDKSRQKNVFPVFIFKRLSSLFKVRCLIWTLDSALNKEAEISETIMHYLD